MSNREIKLGQPTDVTGGAHTNALDMSLLGPYPLLPKPRCGPETGHAVQWLASDLIEWRDACIEYDRAQRAEPAAAAQPTELLTALWEAIGHHSAQVAETGDMAPGQKLLDAVRAVEMVIRPPAVAVPDGWKLVPELPTQDMCESAKYGIDARLSVFKWADGYKAMLSSAPEFAALAATPAADAPLPLLVRDIARELGITCVEACLALKPLGNFSTNTAVTAGMMAKLRECFPERVPASEVAGARERMTAGRACYFMERFLKEEKLLGPNEQAALHYVIDMLEAAAAPVVLPEPVPTPCRSMFATQREYADAMAQHRKNWAEVEAERALLATGKQAKAVERIVIDMKQTAELLDLFGGEATEFTVMQCNGHSGPGLYAYVTEYPEDGASFLGKTDSDATPTSQAQAVGRGEVLVTVSGFTGSGKSAIAGEIEILCRALGLQVEWPDGESEKNMTHADWTAALEQYKPRVRIVEQNIPFVSKKGLSK